MATYQQKIGISVDQKQVSKLIVNLKFIEKKIRKLNQTSLNLGRVRTRSRNIRGTGRNTATGERKIPTDKDGNVLVSKGVERSIKALNKANKALNEYVRKISTADGAQRGFAGSTNKISTQVSALRDRLKGLTRSNSEYTSTLAAVQRGEQALFQDRNKRLGDESKRLATGGKGGTKDLVTNILNEDFTQSVDGINNYINRLEALKNKVNINSQEFKELQQRIAEVNKTLESTQLKKPKPEPKPQKTKSNANQIKAIEEQRANIIQRINDSSLGQAKKNELINNLKRVGVELDNKQLALAKQINVETQRNLTSSEKRQRRRQRIGQSALIGGGFPLLFGGGPLQAAAGALGGGIGEAISPGGGFAGSIAATAAISSITQAVNAISELGKALGPFTQNTESIVNSLGLQNSAQAAQIKFIQQTKGETEAFNAAMKLMANDIGQNGVNALQKFGESSRILGSDFKLAMTRLQSFTAELLNFGLRLSGVENLLKKADNKRLVDLAAQRGNTKAIELLAEQKRIDKLPKEEVIVPFPGPFPGSLFGVPQQVKSKQAQADQSELDKQFETVANQERGFIQAQQKTIETENLLDNLEEELKLRNKVEDLIKKGNSETLAEKLAKTELIFEKETETLNKIIEGNKKRLNTENLSKKEAQELRDINIGISNLIDKQNDKKRDAIKLQKELNTETQKIKITRQEIADLLANETTSAVMGLIEGTKTLGEALASIAKSLAKMFLNAAFQNIFNNLIVGQEQGGYNRAGSFKAFQYGGVVSSPTLGMIGEGGEPEYVIPSSKMSGAMARYSAGARGGAVIPGGSGASGTVAGSSGNTIVEYTGPVLNFNGDEYVPKSAVPEIINTAARQGGEAGKTKAISALRNSRSQRASLGL